MAAAPADPLWRAAKGHQAADPRGARGSRGAGLRSLSGLTLLVPSLQFSVCTWLKPDEQLCFLEESERITPASVKVVNSCATCLRRNITEEGELNSYSKERGMFSRKNVSWRLSEKR